MKADLYPAGDEPLNAYAFQHVVPRTLAGHAVLLAPATYVVAMKLRYFAMSHQDKHLRDIRGIMAVSAREVDATMVESVAIGACVLDAWRECQRRIGEE